MNGEWVVRPQDDGGTDPAQVGAKSAELAELSRKGIRVPAGFVVTADAYREFVRAARLGPVIAAELRRYRAGRDVVAVAAAIRTAFREASLPPALVDEILAAYQELGGDGTEVAVRCSPVTRYDNEREEVFLRLRSGADVVAACRRCFAALFSFVAVGNRELRGPDHLAAAMPVVVQEWVRSDLGASGTARGESTFVRVSAVSGPDGDPDRYSVHPGARPMITRHLITRHRGGVSRVVLTDDELQELACWSGLVDKHFKRPMELEWAKDGPSGRLFLIEVREWSLPAVTLPGPAPAVRVHRR
ncbi:MULTISPECIES: PEP/pyruvate-binding domain-containing protein [unclassified Kribbella]|uniref:PEP/pyruvate-binding domain-containing protein n=1 Tax=unclassified Kribbella TaxID=2644121 RepID=UPI0033D05FE8